MITKLKNTLLTLALLSLFGYLSLGFMSEIKQNRQGSGIKISKTHLIISSIGY